MKPKMDVARCEKYRALREEWLRQNPKRTAAAERTAMDAIARKLLGCPVAKT